MEDFKSFEQPPQEPQKPEQGPKPELPEDIEGRKIEQPAQQPEVPKTPETQENKSEIGEQLLRNQLEQMYGKSLEELYREDVMDGLRGLQEQVRKAKRDIYVGGKLKEYLEKAKGGQEITEDQKKIVKLLKEWGVDENSLTEKSKEIEYEKWSIEEGIKDYKKQNDQALNERQLFTKKFGAYEEFFGTEEKPIRTEAMPETPLPKSETESETKSEIRKLKPDQAKAYRGYIENNYKETEARVRQYEDREKELELAIEKLWPTQFYKRNILKDELEGVRKMKEQYKEFAGNWEKELAVLETEKPAKAEKKESIKAKEISKEKQITEINQKAEEYSKAIAEINQELKKLWPWQINKKYQLLGKLERAQSRLDTYLKASENLRTGKIKHYFDFSKSPEEELD